MVLISYENSLLQSRKNLKEMEDLFYDLSNFAAEENEWEGMGLKDVVEKVKPDILIGLSGVGGIFTGFSHNKSCSDINSRIKADSSSNPDEVLTTMSDNCAGPPIIFALSNPTSRSECNAEQAQVYSLGGSLKD